MPLFYDEATGLFVRPNVTAPLFLFAGAPVTIGSSECARALPKPASAPHLHLTKNLCFPARSLGRLPVRHPAGCFLLLRHSRGFQERVPGVRRWDGKRGGRLRRAGGAARVDPGGRHTRLPPSK